METNEAGFQGHPDDGVGPEPVQARRRPPSNQTSAWVLTAWMVLAPLLMLITIWVLTMFRR